MECCELFYDTDGSKGIEDEFGVEGVIERRGHWELSWKLQGRDECWEDARRGLGVYEKQGGEL